MSGLIETVTLDTTETLMQWSIWSRSHNMHLHCKGFDYTRYVKTQMCERCTITDDEAMRVDQLIASIKRKAPVWHRALLLRFLFNKNPTAIGVELGVKTTKAREIVSDAVSFMGGLLINDEK